jgi:hypothetical protein
MPLKKLITLSLFISTILLSCKKDKNPTPTSSPDLAGVWKSETLITKTHSTGIQDTTHSVYYVIELYREQQFMILQDGITLQGAYSLDSEDIVMTDTLNNQTTRLIKTADGYESIESITLPNNEIIERRYLFRKKSNTPKVDTLLDADWNVIKRTMGVVTLENDTLTKKTDFPTPYRFEFSNYHQVYVWSSNMLRIHYYINEGNRALIFSGFFDEIFWENPVSFNYKLIGNNKLLLSTRQPTNNPEYSNYLIFELERE